MLSSVTTLMPVAPERVDPAGETPTLMGRRPPDSHKKQGESEEVEGFFVAALALASAPAELRGNPIASLPDSNADSEAVINAVTGSGQESSASLHTLFPRMTPASPDAGVETARPTDSLTQTDSWQLPDSASQSDSLLAKDNFASLDATVPSPDGPVSQAPQMNIVSPASMDRNTGESIDGPVPSADNVKADFSVSETDESSADGQASRPAKAVIEVPVTQQQGGTDSQNQFDARPRTYHEDSGNALTEVSSATTPTITKSISPEMGSSTPAETKAHDAAASVLSQLTKAVTLSAGMNAGREDARIELELDPPELGRVWIRLSSLGSAVSAHVRASNEAAVTLIESQITALLESLQSAGMSIDNVQVDQQADFFGFDKHPSADSDGGPGREPPPHGNKIAADQQQLPAKSSLSVVNGMVDILV